MRRGVGAVKVLGGAACLLAIAFGAAACGSVHRARVASGPTPPGKGPTKYMCAVAWNRSVPKSVLAWDRRHHVWEATVQSDVENVTRVSFGNGQPATTTSQTEVWSCILTFAAPRGGMLDVTGEWRAGAISGWDQPHRIQLPAGSGNACVSRNGTIRPLGSFTASSRCPRNE